MAAIGGVLPLLVFGALRCDPDTKLFSTSEQCIRNGNTCKKEGDTMLQMNTHRKDKIMTFSC